MDVLLLQLGILVFLIGLLAGFVIPKFANPRMGLANHLEGLMNGLFLVVLGLVWQRPDLPGPWLAVAFWLATLLAAIWKAGATMPMAAIGNHGSTLQESLINFLLYSLSIAMVSVCIIVIVGLQTG